MLQVRKAHFVLQKMQLLQKNARPPLNMNRNSSWRPLTVDAKRESHSNPVLQCGVNFTFAAQIQRRLFTR
jgi:hypothetical protein